jgi:hypothetical protein
MDVCLLWVLCCQVEVSATGWSLVQRSPTECGVSECDREASTMRRPRPTRAVEPWKKKNINICKIEICVSSVISNVLYIKRSFSLTCLCLIIALWKKPKHVACLGRYRCCLKIHLRLTDHLFISPYNQLLEIN